jgi:hypothetical protein
MKSNGRLLKYQRNVFAANGLKLTGLRFEKILPLKQNSAVGNNGVPAEQPQQRYRQRAFSRAGFSKDAQDLSRFQAKTDSVERARKVSIPRAISHSEIANFQNRPHARMLKQDSEGNKKNVSASEPRVIPTAQVNPLTASTAFA